MDDKKNDFFGDFEFNYTVVIFGKLTDLQQIKDIIEKTPGVTVRYQTLDRGKLIIQREGER